jgi:hypothetical protein
MGQAHEEVAATPQRPSFSTSTTTTHVGWLELEAGLSVDEHLFDSPFVFKLGTSRDSELFVGLSPVMNVSNGVSETGFGDIALGGRWRFKEGTTKSPSFAGQFSIKLPTADEDRGLGTGEVGYNALLIINHTFATYSLDFNVGLSGRPGSGTIDQVPIILTLSRGLNSKLSGFGELFIDPSFDSENSIFIGSFGGSYYVSPRIVLDAALNVNISKAPFDVRFLFGFTTTFARIW